MFQKIHVILNFYEYMIWNIVYIFVDAVKLPVQCSHHIWHFPTVKSLLDITSSTGVSSSSPVAVILFSFPIIISLGIALRVSISVSSLKIIPFSLSTISSISLGFLIFAESKSRKSPIVLMSYRDEQNDFKILAQEAPKTIIETKTTKIRPNRK